MKLCVHPESFFLISGVIFDVMPVGFGAQRAINMLFNISFWVFLVFKSLNLKIVFDVCAGKMSCLKKTPSLPDAILSDSSNFILKNLDMHVLCQWLKVYKFEIKISDMGKKLNFVKPSDISFMMHLNWLIT